MHCINAKLDGEEFRAREVQVLLHSNVDEEAPATSPIVVHVGLMDPHFHETIVSRLQTAEEHGVPLEFKTFSYSARWEGQDCVIAVENLQLLRTSDGYLTFIVTGITQTPSSVSP